MSDRSSPVNDGYEASEPAMRLSVRKDLFPDARLSQLATDSDSEDELVSCVKLETDFEQSIDAIASQRMQVNGALPSPTRPRHRKHKQHSRRDTNHSTLNGCLPKERKRKKRSRDSHKRTHTSKSVVSQVKGGKNLNLVSSSECHEEEEVEEAEEESESSDDEVLGRSVKLPLINVQRASGKPYSHRLSQLSTKKSKSKEQRTHIVIPCSGKPRSMLDLCSSRSKKKSKKSDCSTPTYRSQIVDTNTKIKIKIRRTSFQEVVAPTPTSIAELGQRKSKKKRAASPVASASSGEEYDPSRGDAVMSVAAPKPRATRSKTKKSNNNNSKTKAQWKVCNVSWVLACVVDYCPGLVELSVAGWSRITPEQLFDVVQGLPKLQRLDLSLTSETGGSSTCLSAASMARVASNCGTRLTHLTLANNKFSALPQILSSVASHCPNLEVLDISGAQATSHPAPIPLEALQKGCPKIRVFSAANAQLVLASATKTQQMEAGGWTQLEEVSIAGSVAEERAAVGDYRLGDEALARLVRGATRLSLLDLRGLQRITDSGLVRVPAWDLQHLFLGGCNVLRQTNACLELICEKWSHSLIELDLSWASNAKVLHAAVCALAESPNSKLRVLNLCGSSVSYEAVKKVLLKCPRIESLNLSSCRALPRGMKRLYLGKELQDLKDGLDPEKVKAKESKTEESKKKKTNAQASKTDDDKESKKNDAAESSGSSKVEIKSPDKSSDTVFQEPKSIPDLSTSVPDKRTSIEKQIICSPSNKSDEQSKNTSENLTSEAVRKLSSPLAQSKPDSSSTPRSDSVKTDTGSPHYSPVQKPDSQIPSSPDVPPELVKGNHSWNLGQFKSTPSHKSEASPLNRLESHTKIRHAKVIEQCSPTTSLENKPSPETIALKQDIKNLNNWNYSSYSPMPRQESQFSSQRSPYSAQPSPAQPSPYSTQPSPYSTQPSPYSSQPSPYSAQPSPDTSQIVKADLQKSGAWNNDNYSPMPKHHAPFSPHPSTHTSPDPGLGVKNDNLRNNPNRTPGQYSPMSRQQHHSPYSPRPSVENTYSNKKSPGVVKYSHLPSPDGGHASRTHLNARAQDVYGRSVSKVLDITPNVPPPEIPNTWGFNHMNTPTTGIESLVWGTPSFGTEPAIQSPLHSRVDNMPTMLNTPPPQPWGELSPFDSGVRRAPDANDPWTLGQFRVEPPSQVHNTFVEQNVSFEPLGTHLSHGTHALHAYLDDAYSETSRAD
ncbi:jg2890 [Pararge aegeria aegeria]|uniref:Jg2890 protein n=1 Tax=Pararge aegeria aegeria TaxID=348720 RepID=A0A8S4SGF0_9NEOP|nr:jg2890 [Pararge aegeria aegeria]